MKRKYYMRGLGIGVIITAILFTVAFPKNKPAMTDEEIIAKAKELGYVKKTEGVTPEDIDKIKEQEGIGTTPGGAQDSTTTPGPTTSPVPTPDAPTPPEEPDKPDAPEMPTNVPTREVLPDTPTPKPTVTPEPTPTLEPTKAPTKKPTATVAPTKAPATGVITVKVERGMTATKVARLLEAAGAIDSATEFASYLRENNLADEINIGTFSVPAGATYEEIGKLLTEIR